MIDGFGQRRHKAIGIVVATTRYPALDVSALHARARPTRPPHKIDVSSVRAKGRINGDRNLQACGFGYSDVAGLDNRHQSFERIAVGWRIALRAYARNNCDAIVNYHRRYHDKRPVATSRAEGCVDEIANARMGKKQRMRWLPRGAHRVAVVRAAVLDGRLSSTVTIPLAA